MLVDVHLVGLGHGLGLADYLFQVIKFLQLQVAQFQQLVIVKAVVLEAVAYHALHIDFLELLQHTRHIELVHPGAFDGYDRAEIEEVAHNLAVSLRGLSRLGGNLGGLCKHTQGAIGRKVEHVTLLLHTPVDGGRSLYPENSLHVAGCRRVVGT